MDWFYFLAWLFWNKKWKYCHDPGVVGVVFRIGVGFGVTNFKFRHISDITEDIYLNFGTKNRAAYTIKGDKSQCILTRIRPVFMAIVQQNGI